MITNLLKLFIIILPIQIILIMLGAGVYLQYPITEPDFFVFFINTISFMIFLSVSWLLIRKIESESFNNLEFNNIEKFSVLASFLLLSLFNVLIVSSFDSRGMLNQIQGQSNLGLIFKISVTFLPAIFTVCVFAFKDSWKILTIFFIIMGYVTVINSTNMSTKLPIMSVIIAIMYMYSKRLLSMAALQPLLISAAVLTFFVYLYRDSQSLLNNQSLIASLYPVFRLPMIYESSHILDFVARSGPLSADFLYVHEAITSDIFKLDSRFTGVASGFVGLFWAYFGISGLFFGLLFLIILLLGLRTLMLDGYFTKIKFFLYLVWCFELQSLFIDGNLSFITGTNGYLMFYVLFGITIFVLILDLFFFDRRSKLGA